MDHLTWRKSSRSGSNGTGACVEVACPPSSILVRDSKNRTSVPLSFPTSSWTTFLKTR